MAKSTLKTLAKAVVPAPLLATYRAKALVGRAARQLIDSGEPEARYLAALCNPNRAAVDIGGNIGAYAFHLRRQANRLHVFEPLPELADRIDAAFPLDRRVSVHNVALSDTVGTATLRVPLLRGGQATALASIDPANTLGGLETVEISVPMKRLDDFSITGVGFIKVDVEGHELAVLRGAVSTLTTNDPVVMVEAEERHRAGTVADLFAFMAGVGYRGLFLLNGAWREAETFDAMTHQPADGIEIDHRKPGAAYVNNFVFARDREALRCRLERITLKAA